VVTKPELIKKKRTADSIHLLLEQRLTAEFRSYWRHVENMPGASQLQASLKNYCSFSALVAAATTTQV